MTISDHRGDARRWIVAYHDDRKLFTKLIADEKQILAKSLNGLSREALADVIGDLIITRQMLEEVGKQKDLIIAQLEQLIEEHIGDIKAKEFGGTLGKAFKVIKAQSKIYAATYTHATQLEAKEAEAHRTLAKKGTAARQAKGADRDNALYEAIIGYFRANEICSNKNLTKFLKDQGLHERLGFKGDSGFEKKVATIAKRCRSEIREVKSQTETS